MDIIQEENTIIAQDTQNVDMTDVSPAVSPDVQGTGSQTENNKRVIVFCLTGHTFSTEFLKSWTEVFAYCLMNDITPVLSTSGELNSVLAKNKCLSGNTLNGPYQTPFQGKIKYERIIWLDTKMIFNVEMIKKLLSVDENIVSGMFVQSNLKTLGFIKTIDKDHFMEKGTYNYMTRDELLEWKKENTSQDLLEVEHCDLGFMMMKYGILEKLAYPWFKQTMTTIQDGSGNVMVQEYNTEDFSLIQTLRESGERVFVDTSIMVGREHNIIF